MPRKGDTSSKARRVHYRFLVVRGALGPATLESPAHLDELIQSALLSPEMRHHCVFPVAWLGAEFRSVRMVVQTIMLWT